MIVVYNLTVNVLRSESADFATTAMGGDLGVSGHGKCSPLNVASSRGRIPSLSGFFVGVVDATCGICLTEDLIDGSVLVFDGGRGLLS